MLDLYESENGCKGSGAFNLPYEVAEIGSFGLLNKTTPVVCGGESPLAGVSNVCYILGSTGIIKRIAMARQVKQSASTVIFGGSTLWVTGGLNLPQWATGLLVMHQ